MGLGRQLPYQIENAFLLKNHQLWSWVPVLVTVTGHCFWRKLKNIFIQIIREKHYNHSWNRSNRVVCPSQLRVEALPQLPKLFCWLGIEVDRQSGAHCCFKPADLSFIVEHWVVKPIKNCFIIKPRIARGAKPKLTLWH